MPYEFYKVLHLTGLFFLFTSLGGMLVHVLNGGTREFPSRKMVGLIHGIGMLLLLVAGFGLAARLGLVSGLPGWVWAKLVIWFILGGLPALIYRGRDKSKPLWAITIILGICAAYLAIYKPF